jgi:hypothetical protein
VLYCVLQGTFAGQQITVQAEDGQMVTVNPETIIVQQEGEEVLLSDGTSGLEGASQYVIQYVTPHDPHADAIHSLVEIQDPHANAVHSLVEIQTAMETAESVDEQPHEDQLT